MPFLSVSCTQFHRLPVCGLCSCLCFFWRRQTLNFCASQHTEVPFPILLRIVLVFVFLTVTMFVGNVFALYPNSNISTCNLYTSGCFMETRFKKKNSLPFQILYFLVEVWITYTGLFKMIVRVLTTCHTQYTSFSRCNPVWFLSMRLRQGSGLCSSSSRKYPGTEGTNQNRHWNRHRWHATNSLERTGLSCWCL